MFATVRKTGNEAAAIRSSEILSPETLAVEERRKGVESVGKVRDDGNHGGDWSKPHLGMVRRGRSSNNGN